MVTIKVGETYPAKNFRSGVGSKGAWAVFHGKAQKGYDTINVWASNPDEVVNAAGLKIKSIDSVTLKARQDPKTNQWFKDYSITATLEKTEDVRFGGEQDMDKAEADFVNSLFGI